MLYPAKRWRDGRESNPPGPDRQSGAFAARPPPREKCSEKSWLGRMDLNHRWRGQSPLPFRLATPQWLGGRGSNARSADSKSAAVPSQLPPIVMGWPAGIEPAPPGPRPGALPTELRPNLVAGGALESPYSGFQPDARPSQLPSRTGHTRSKWLRRSESNRRLRLMRPSWNRLQSTPHKVLVKMSKNLVGKAHFECALLLPDTPMKTKRGGTFRPAPSWNP